MNIHEHFTHPDNWPHRVSRYNPVYLDCPRDPMDGLPLGNGHIGALLWCDDSRLYCVLNRSELWTEVAAREFHNWDIAEEERSPTLRHGGRIVIDFGLPVFDTVYLTDCRIELDLTTGSATGAVTSVFGTVEWSALVTEGADFLRLKWRTRLTEAARQQVTVERYGSRSFGRWYSQWRHEPEAGLAETRCTARADGIAVSDTASGGRFVLAASCFGADAKPLPGRRNNRFGGDFTIDTPGTWEVAALLSAPGGAEGLEGERRLAAECRVAYDERLQRNAGRWRDFWQRSHLSGGDPHLDGLWHLHMYYANAAQRGPVPGRFIGGLWEWMHDFQAWGFFFHWNQQMIYWSLEAAGHAAVCRPYLDWRFQALECNRSSAALLFQRPGGWASDVCDWRGCPSVYERSNHTPPAQIALEFYRHYRYTGDLAFLRDRALPYMIDAALFLAAGLEAGDDGKLHTASGSACEGWILFTDQHSELMCLRTLLPAVLEALRLTGTVDARCDGFADILTRLAEVPLMADLEAASAPDGSCGVGVAAGVPWRGTKRFAAGRRVSDGAADASFFASSAPLQYATEFAIRRLERQRPLAEAPQPLHPANNEGIGPGSETLGIFPCGVIGLADRGTEAYDIAWNTVLAQSSCEGIIAWDPEPVLMARLGMGELLERQLHGFISSFQAFANGWFADSFLMREALLARGENMIYDVERGDPRLQPRRPVRAWPFRHMGLEGLGVVACALNERFLQSHDGVIRIAPAVTAKMTAEFTLHAVGGHVVSAQVREGGVCWARIEIGWAAGCRVSNPWRRARLTGPDGRVAETEATELALAGGSGELWLLQDAAAPAAPELRLTPETPSVREQPGGLARIGIPRLF